MLSSVTFPIIAILFTFPVISTVTTSPVASPVKIRPSFVISNVSGPIILPFAKYVAS